MLVTTASNAAIALNLVGGNGLRRCRCWPECWQDLTAVCSWKQMGVLMHGESGVEPGTVCNTMREPLRAVNQHGR